ncbi:hypothetical protein, partial [Phycicoccus jejuensis]|uniref:hypothetical protein n=1 Tax=Phycicoccus jejuensis TaxID=367299 RepID=UPI00056596B1
MTYHPAVAVVVVSAAMTAWTVTSRRLVFWASFSPLAAAVGLLLTFTLLCFVCAAGVSSSGLLSQGAQHELTRDLAAAGVAAAALRRAKEGERGATLALGFLPEVHSWVDAAVERRIEFEARRLSDAALIDAAAALDDPTRGYGPGSTAEQRADWRRQQALLLASPDTATGRQARQDIISLVGTAEGSVDTMTCPTAWFPDSVVSLRRVGVSSRRVVRARSGCG